MRETNTKVSNAYISILLELYCKLKYLTLKALNVLKGISFKNAVYYFTISVLNLETDVYTLDFPKLNFVDRILHNK